MRTRQLLLHKYRSYESQGHFILCVTLSTYIRSAVYANSDRTRHFWGHHFIGKVDWHMPYKACLDHDYVMERCPRRGFWHYHGLLAVTQEHGRFLWKDGSLNRQLAKTLDIFRWTGPYRPFRVFSFLIEPVKKVDAWCNYITKQITVERS